MERSNKFGLQTESMIKILEWCIKTKDEDDRIADILVYCDFAAAKRAIETKDKLMLANHEHTYQVACFVYMKSIQIGELSRSELLYPAIGFYNDVKAMAAKMYCNFETLEAELAEILRHKEVEFKDGDYTYIFSNSENKVHVIQVSTEDRTYVDDDNLYEFFNDVYGYSIELLKTIVEENK